nr:MAG TPA: hypothetical protein [Caudoviricetes sp.]
MTSRPCWAERSRGPSRLQLQGPRQPLVLPVSWFQRPRTLSRWLTARQSSLESPPGRLQSACLRRAGTSRSA